MINSFVIGFGLIFNLYAIILIVAGVIAGIIFAAIPGLTGTMAIAVFLPLTFKLSSYNAMAFLMGLYIGAASGSLISAILINIPGQVSSIATTFDGYPMTLRGEAGKALGTGIFFSFLGGFFSFIILFFSAPALATVALKFGPFEYFAIALFALTLISSVSEGSLAKGLSSALFGVAFGFVGISPIDGLPRYTFGYSNLNIGIGILPALIGIYAVSELIGAANKKNVTSKTPSFSIKGFGFSFREFKNQVPNFARSSLIGTIIGILPGIGGGLSNLLAYISAKKVSKHPEKFGTGIMDGVVATESANNASVGGALIPLMVLGIPGDTFTAILIGAFMVHGIQPGPLLFINNADLVYTVFASLIVANFVMLALQYKGIKLFVKVLNIPKHIMISVIMVFCVVGVFAASNNIFDVWLLLIFGVFGIVMKRLGFPFTPFVLGLILGPMAEINFRRAVMMSQGKWMMFFSKPLSAIFLIAAMLSILVTVIREVKSYVRKRN
jgi:putative tricarboxylic transport membrane protein